MKVRRYIRIRVPHGEDFAIGPGKADLLRSHSAHRIDLWGRPRVGYVLPARLVACRHHEPLLSQAPSDTATGGTAGGGAFVTGLGMQALQIFRGMEAKALAAVQEDLDKLGRLLAPPKG